MVFLIVFTVLLCPPIKPWIPDRSELHELVGIPVFKKFNTYGSGSGIHFNVNDGVLLHCGFNGSLGGMNGCDWNDVVASNKQVRVTYFIMKTGYGQSARMLNSLEQDEKLVISPEYTYKQRLIDFNSDKKSRRVILLVFSFIALILFGNERAKATSKLSQI